MSISKTKLAQELGISRTMLYRHEAAGMPTTSYSEAKSWYDMNLHPGMSKQGRLFGNDGGHPKKRPKEDIERDTAEYILRDVVPQIWFDQPQWIGYALQDAGVKITAEQVYRTQVNLLYMYMDVVNDYFQEDATFKIGDIMMIRPEDEAYPSLIESLNKILKD